MTKPLKTILLMAAGVPGVLILAWLATWVYWHVRITRAIHGIESVVTSATPSQRAYGESIEVLESARCRSLPYLLSNMDPTKHVWFLGQMQYFIRSSSLPLEGSDKELDGALGEFHIDPLDSPQLIRTKWDGLRRWWAESDHKYHQWWRIWSSSCRDARGDR